MWNVWLLEKKKKKNKQGPLEDATKNIKTTKIQRKECVDANELLSVEVVSNYCEERVVLISYYVSFPSKVARNLWEQYENHGFGAESLEQHFPTSNLTSQSPKYIYFKYPKPGDKCLKLQTRASNHNPCLKHFSSSLTSKFVPYSWNF